MSGVMGLGLEVLTIVMWGKMNVRWWWWSGLMVIMFVRDVGLLQLRVC